MKKLKAKKAVSKMQPKTLGVSSNPIEKTKSKATSQELQLECHVDETNNLVALNEKKELLELDGENIEALGGEGVGGGVSVVIFSVFSFSSY